MLSESHFTRLFINFTLINFLFKINFYVISYKIMHFNNDKLEKKFYEIMEGSRQSTGS